MEIAHDDVAFPLRLFILRGENIYCSQVYPLLLFTAKLWIQTIDILSLLFLWTVHPWESKTLFGLGWGCVRIWGSGCVKKVRVFGLRYVRVDVRGKFMRVCEWCDGCEKILIFLKVWNVTLQIYPCLLKKLIKKWVVFV